MRQHLLAAGVAVTVALAPATVEAQTSINYFAQFAQSTTVIYLPFEVFVGSIFSAQTSGLSAIDPMIRLFAGTAFDGPSLGASLAVGDDGGPAQPGWNHCTGNGGSCQSLITINLAPGVYTLALSVFDFTEAEARAGVATFYDPTIDPPPGTSYGDGVYCNAAGDYSNCNYSVTLSSDQGVAAITATPEPATMGLMATGFVGLAGFARRKKNGSLSV